MEGESGCLQAAGELEEPLRNMEVVRKHLVRDISNSITWIGHIYNPKKRFSQHFSTAKRGQNKIPVVKEVFHSN